MKVVSVIIPCKNDAKLLVECLSCIQDAAEHVQAEGVYTQIVLSIDPGPGFVETVRLAEGAGAWSFASKSSTVGGARHEGAVFAGGKVGVGEEHFLLFTDADTEVPLSWIQVHERSLRRHASSWGSVWLQPSSPFWPVLEAARKAGRLDNRLFEQNCAVEAGAYFRVGGFADLQREEGPDLLRRLRQGGSSEVRTPMAVITSDRKEGRVVGGFASALRDLTKS